MREILTIGKEIVDEIGHKEYGSADEFFNAIAEGKSPLNEIDADITPDPEGLGTNIFAVKKCVLGDLMDEMLQSKEGRDDQVEKVMNGFMIRENEKHSFLDIGCYIVQSIRQMVVSSIKIAGKYDINYIHLACKRGDKVAYCEGDIEAIGVDMDKLTKILDTHECIFALSFKEGQ